MSNITLHKAKLLKNDEFYTQYKYIEKEVNAYLEYNPNFFKNKIILMPCDDPEWSNFTKYFAQNFKKLGLKKLISTSYALDKNINLKNKTATDYQINSPQFNAKINSKRGKIFTLTKQNLKNVNFDDLTWDYLEGDGDFRSVEVLKLLDESDVIVTNPPFSLFREFVDLLVGSEKQFMIIGRQGSIGYKNVFSYFKENKLWMGATGNNVDMVFRVPEGSTINSSDKEKAKKLGYDGSYTRLGNACWFTNIDHGVRHEPIQLLSMKEVFRYNRHKDLKGVKKFKKYVNYKGVDIPYSDMVPSDYKGVMGVPISFLVKYSPEQFEIVGFRYGKDGKDLRFDDGTTAFQRVLIRHKKV